VLPFIIGKKGATMKGIQEMTGAHIQIPKREDVEVTSVVADDENEEEQVEITIEGIDAAVVKAKEELNKIINEKVVSLLIFADLGFEKDRTINGYTTRLLSFNCRAERLECSRMGGISRSRHQNPHPQSSPPLLRRTYHSHRPPRPHCRSPRKD
jgi:polyribonucleotide nucleotidyltransferase